MSPLQYHLVTMVTSSSSDIVTFYILFLSLQEEQQRRPSAKLLWFIIPFLLLKLGKVGASKGKWDTAGTSKQHPANSHRVAIVSCSSLYRKYRQRGKQASRFRFRIEARWGIYYLQTPLSFALYCRHLPEPWTGVLMRGHTDRQSKQASNYTS